MARCITFAVWGSLGDLHPYLAIASGMKARGHRCVVATNKFFKPRVEAAGLEFAPLGPHLGPDAEFIKKINRPWRGAMSLMKDIVFPYSKSAFDETMSAIEGADLLVTHPIAYAAHVAAEKTGIRWASTVLAPMGFFSLHQQPPNALSLSSFALDTLRSLANRLVLSLGPRLTRPWTAPIRQLRADLGLSAGAHPIFEGQFSPALTLALFSPLLGEPQPDWPPNTVITGFPFYSEPAALDPKLCEFLENNNPPVVFTLGSSASMTPGAFFEESAAAIRRVGCRAVLVVGEFASTLPREPLPPNVAVFPYAPYALLFPRAAVNVHQGGIGTTAEALRSGRPMLVVPFAFDQPDNAARAEALGVARSLPIGSYSAKRAAQHLDQLLHEASYRRDASAIGERVRREDGVGASCKALEALLVC